MRRWYRLDNAGKLYPAVATQRNSSVYRVSGVLKERIDASILQKAVDMVLPRFPMLAVRMRRGVFWHYFDANDRRLFVREDGDFPCYPIDPQAENGYLMKVLYYRCRVSVEIFHSVTDGSGAIEFLKSLLFYYLLFSGKEVRSEGLVRECDEAVSPSDVEDGFRRYYAEASIVPEARENAYIIRGTDFDVPGNNVVHGALSASGLNAVARRRGGTITAYLAAVLMRSIYQTRQSRGMDERPVVVAIPVNLRKLFPSRTLRNFYGVVNVEAGDLAVVDLDALVARVDASLREKTSAEALQGLITANVNLEARRAARIVPLFAKKLLIRLGNDLWGETKKTITLSNLGRIDLPSTMSEHVEQIECAAFPTPRSPINCGVCSLGDRLLITFTRAIEEADILQRFFSHLSREEGLDVFIYSNDWGGLRCKDATTVDSR